MGVQDYADHPKLKPSVVLTGSAKECNSGPTIGLIDIGVSQSAFLFRVALPGIRNDQSKVSIYNYVYYWSVKCSSPL